MEALADAWCAKFCCHDGVLLTQSSNAFVASLAFALSWQAAGGALIAPIVARAFVALDTYVLRPEPENARVSVPLSAVAPAPPTPEGDEVAE